MRTLVIAGIVLGSTVAFAQSIEEKQARAAAEDAMAFSVKQMNKYCKTTLAPDGILDWATWKTAVDPNSSTGKASSQCGLVLYGAQNMCSDKVAQETIAKDVKKIVCHGDSTDDVKFELKGDTLVIHTKFGVKDTDKKTKAWLAKNLP